MCVSVCPRDISSLWVTSLFPGSVGSHLHATPTVPIRTSRRPIRERASLSLILGKLGRARRSAGARSRGQPASVPVRSRAEPTGPVGWICGFLTSLIKRVVFYVTSRFSSNINLWARGLNGSLNTVLPGPGSEPSPVRLAPPTCLHQQTAISSSRSGSGILWVAVLIVSRTTGAECWPGSVWFCCPCSACWAGPSVWTRTGRFRSVIELYYFSVQSLTECNGVLLLQHVTCYFIRHVVVFTPLHFSDNFSY